MPLRACHSASVTLGTDMEPQCHLDGMGEAGEAVAGQVVVGKMAAGKLVEGHVVAGQVVVGQVVAWTGGGGRCCPRATRMAC